MKYNIEFHKDQAASVSVVAGGEPYVADKDHPNFVGILDGLKQDNLTDEDVAVLFDTGLAISNKFEDLSDRVTVYQGKIHFDGVELKNSLTDRVLGLLRNGDDFKPFVTFLENVAINPNEHSKEHLFGYLERYRFSITDDGHFIAYKSVNPGTYLSQNRGTAIVDGEVITGQIPNKPGSVITMPRDQVLHDPNQGCSIGLHAATFGFARNFMSSGTMLMLKIHPRDVVSVPTGEAKMRVCKYKVVKVVTSEDTRDLISLAPAPIIAPMKSAGPLASAGVPNVGGRPTASDFQPGTLEKGSGAEAKYAEAEKERLARIHEPKESLTMSENRAAVKEQKATAKASVKANKKSKAAKVAKSKAKTDTQKKAEIDQSVYINWMRDDFDNLTLTEFRKVAKDFGVSGASKIPVRLRKDITDRLVRRTRDWRRS